MFVSLVMWSDWLGLGAPPDTPTPQAKQSELGSQPAGFGCQAEMPRHSLQPCMQGGKGVTLSRRVMLGDAHSKII